MLVAALAAAVAMTLAADQERWRADVEHRRDQVQAQALALAGIQWARQVVQDDTRAGGLDHLGENWAVPLPPTPVENGAVEGRIVDAQGLLNLNNLAKEGTAATGERVRLARLFAQLGVDAAALDAIADWVDADGTARAAGAEDTWYAAQRPPSLAANAPAIRSGELAAVRGLPAAALAALLPFVVALPPPTALNVNTAPPEVLAATTGITDAQALAALVAGRAQKSFTTVAEFRARLPRGSEPGEAAGYAVSSRYFLVSVRARQGATLAQARALLSREGADRPTIVWQVVQ
jgi:general secretion pathway protein K